MKKVSEKERQSFTFYLSFYKAIKGLKMRERLMIYDTIVEYSLLGKEPKGLSPISQLVWDLIEPTLSKSRVNYLNACKTPHPKKGDKNVTLVNTDSLPSQPLGESTSEMASTDTDTNTNTNTDTDTNRETRTETETETETETRTDRDRDADAQLTDRARASGRGVRGNSPPSKSAKVLEQEYLQMIKSDAMRRAIGEWFEYKRERGEAYRTTRGMHVFCLRLRELSDGNEYRAQQILTNSIANNWSGIFPLKDNYVPIAQRGEGYMRGYS